MTSAPKPLPLNALREQRSLVHGITLRSHAFVLPPASFQARKIKQIESCKNGSFLKDPDSKGKPAGNPMTDPAAMDGMMGMMKGQMMMMVPQTVIMGWINAFFAGFVICESSIKEGD
jgi:ER membrane protein complex subunit 3